MLLLTFPEVDVLLYVLDFKRKRRIATEMSSSRLRMQPSCSLHSEQGLDGRSSPNSRPGPALGVRMETPGYSKTAQCCGTFSQLLGIILVVN